ncbi:MAG: hypothetical protein CBB67_006570 [Alteromonadaceae bacterium TMED7]|nr:hypothetical protein [Alteromonadaceae bacterium]MCP4054826.1 hypothetical protein [Mesoflavibacter sp.]RPH20109.1 MAG: hypothetical protein CBB67_006570 [Alteromonadaceae bacterium TMED7]|tara:strand:- start:1571 stop:1954 length:384 start_codon:yes stop_codon:yes gene_type:complete
MSVATYPWPKDFPNDVPPTDAKDASGKAYRLVRSNPPSDSDFVGHNREPHKKKSKNLKAKDYGTSMFRKLKNIEEAREMFKAQRDKSIAEGVLDSIHGKISKEREDSHFEAWLREKTGIESCFKVVK